MNIHAICQRSHWSTHISAVRCRPTLDDVVRQNVILIEPSWSWSYTWMIYLFQYSCVSWCVQNSVISLSLYLLTKFNYRDTVRQMPGNMFSVVVLSPNLNCNPNVTESGLPPKSIVFFMACVPFFKLNFLKSEFEFFFYVILFT